MLIASLSQMVEIAGVNNERHRPADTLFHGDDKRLY